MEYGSKVESAEEYSDTTGGSAEGTGEQDSTPSLYLQLDGKAEVAGTSKVQEGIISNESEEVRKRTIPPPGTGQRIYEIDPLLKGFSGHLDYRYCLFPSVLRWQRPVSHGTY